MGAVVVAGAVVVVAGGTVLVLLATVVATVAAVVLGGAAVDVTGEAAAPVHALSPATSSAALSTAGGRVHDVRATNIDLRAGRGRAGGHPRQFDPSELPGTPRMCARAAADRKVVGQIVFRVVSRACHRGR